MFLGAVQISTKRAAQGIRECERALALDRNLADAHGFIGCAKVLIGRAEEAEAHIQEAFRLSPRDTGAYRWMRYAGLAKLVLGADAEAVSWLRRSLEANRNHPLAHFQLAAALALLGSLEDARDAVRAGLALHPSFTIRRTRGKMSDDLTFRAWSERIREGMRLAGVPEG
jgi:tetratricopeptide (TPR) repeat protein